MKLQIKRRIGILLVVIILLISSFLSYVYLNDRPGGFSDQRVSKLLGMDETIHIPTGKTPEMAIQKFRSEQYASQFIHEEPVEGGMIVFTQRASTESSNLQIEFVRKRIFGWKWGWGGGYGIGKSSSNPSAMDYMSMPRLEHIESPFPIIFGNVLNPAIKRITVETKENGTPISTEAKLVEVGAERNIWFVLLPSTASTPLHIKALNEEGILIASKEINDPNDSGSLIIKD
ncbi:hypothetical protein [Paenibacillus illinoisensis]|uniref:hypothetical protein n=1 Tax=Paenibacillus illinoisensis TaxID=59845 RepID=UPI001C8E435F|nr:hypothetical protein [Paenibacillus illinoisensis]MBY0215043.1 hypothetical protein [Paenibacillus illinoisensis]